MGEQVRAFQAEGTAWTKIRRQETVWRMLAEGTGKVAGAGVSPPQTTEGPGLQAVDHREC